MLKRLMIFAAGIMSMFAAYSCADDDGGKNPSEPYYLEFVNETDVLQEFTPSYRGTYDMKLNTNIPRNYLRVSSVDDQVWCSADLSEDGSSILITPGVAQTSALEATFLIDVTKEGEQIEPLTFVVRRLYEEVEGTIVISYEGEALEGEYPILNISGEAQSLSFSVETSASRWKLECQNFSEDEWMHADKMSGGGGDVVSVTFDRNETGKARNQSFAFTPILADKSVTVTVTVIQNAWSSIESVVVKKFNNSTMTAEETLTPGQVINLPASSTSSNRFCFQVDVIGEGGVQAMFAEVGSNELQQSATWAFVGVRSIDGVVDEEWVSVGEYWSINPYSNDPALGYTGEERSVDVVIVPSGSDLQLFRFRITQESWPE